MAETVKLQSSDGQVFEVERAVAEMSPVIKSMMNKERKPILIDDATGKILEKVIEFCRHHLVNPITFDNRTFDEDFMAWDREFCKVDRAILFELIHAADKLKIQLLLDVTCKTVANMIKNLKSSKLVNT
jgi:S-phase kinase-associated protein 1